MSSRFFALSVVAIALPSLIGCSKGGLTTIPVYGTVTFVGEEPKSCRIFFKPIKVEGVNRPAAAERKSDGTYTANAFSTSKGLIPGTYQIEVTYYHLKPGKNPNLESSYAETNFDAGEVVVDASSSGVEHNIEVQTKKG